MSRKFYTPIDLNTNELQNAVIQNLASAPTAIKGRLYFDTVGNVLKLSLDGSTWSSISTGAGSFTLGSTTVNLGGTSGVSGTPIAGLYVSNPNLAGTITTSLTTAGIVKTNGSGVLSSVATLANSDLLNSTISGVALGSNLSALTISTGLTGSSYNGSAPISIALATAGTAGTYTKVTTDAYGRVTSGTTLSASDIPTLGNITNAGAIGSTSGLVVSTTTSGVLTASAALPNGTTATTQAAGDSSTKIATTLYVDTAVTTTAAGFNVHDSVSAATTASLGWTYVAGSTGADGGLGIGATLTSTTTGTSIIDGYTLVLGDRILIKNEATQTRNGVYEVTTAGTTGVATILTRASDYDNSVKGEVFQGDMIYVGAGSQVGSLWVMNAIGTSNSPHNGIKIGTDNITFSQFAGAGTYSASNGIQLVGNAFSGVNATTSSVGVASFPSAQFSVSSGAVSISALSASLISSGTIGYSYLPTTAAANSVATSIARRLTGAGTGTGTSISVNHGFGQWVHAQLFDSSGNLVEVDVQNTATGSGTTTFTFSTSQTLTGFQYVIIG